MVAFASLFLCLLPSARADTDAILYFGSNSFAGYVQQGAVGFSFVPTTNLTVTRVGYYDGTTNLQPFINFWSSTNTVIATYSFGPGSGSQTFIYSNVSLTLTGGQPYSITLQDGPFSAGNVLGILGVSESGAPDFLAPEITNYVCQTVNTNGVFVPFSTNAYRFGPNFSYQLGTNGPLLTISEPVAGTVKVSWPSPSTGYLLQQNADITTTNWSYYIGATNDDGTNKSVTISPPVGDLYFRLIQ